MSEYALLALDLSECYPADGFLSQEAMERELDELAGLLDQMSNQGFEVVFVTKARDDLLIYTLRGEGNDNIRYRLTDKGKAKAE